MRKLGSVAAVVVGLLVFALGAQLGAAQTGIAQQLPPAVYLPLVFQQAPTPTAPPATATSEPTATLPVATTAPQPTQPPVTGVCAAGAPAFAEGAQAWATDPTPAAGAIETVCVRLVRGGAIVLLEPVTITVHYKSKDSSYTGTTGDTGVAAISFDTGRPSKGYTVVVDVFIAGVKTTTSFTPQ